MKRDWSLAIEKVADEGCCRVCGRSGLKLDAAHLIPRSQVSHGGERPENIVPLCAERCHREFDLGGLDLLPFLERPEQAYAVSLVGLEAAYRRLTNQRNPGGL